MMRRRISHCYSCGTRSLLPFYELRDVPVPSPLLATRAEALDIDRTNLRLAFCPACGFIQDVHPASNAERIITSASHSHDPEEAGRRARSLAGRYGIAGKMVLSIGQDPALQAALMEQGASGVECIGPADLSNADVAADMIVCRSTLEQTHDPGRLLEGIRRRLGENREPVVYVEAADTRRVLSGLAFWEIMPGRRSYFSMGSLARLFRRCDFDLFDLRRSLDDKRILVDAVASAGVHEPSWPGEEDIEELRLLLGYFRDNHAVKLLQWNQRIESATRVALWGSGPHEVSLLSSLGPTETVVFAIDEAPDRHGSFLPGSGIEVLPPEALRVSKVDLVLALTAENEAAARSWLDLYGVSAEVLSPWTHSGERRSAGTSTTDPTAMPLRANQPWFTSSPKL